MCSFSSFLILRSCPVFLPLFAALLAAAVADVVASFFADDNLS